MSTVINKAPNSLDDLIDSREIIEAIENLKESDDSTDPYMLIELEALAEQCEGYGDWEYGETLIRDTYFVEYAQELAEDIGAVNVDAVWPNNCIDWELAARELQMDYMAVDFNGVRYWMRA